jgi:NAD-dependent dihydropyrimidine dehydrogenase PreA subunit
MSIKSNLPEKSGKVRERECSVVGALLEGGTRFESWMTEFSVLFEVPDFVLPYLSCFVSRPEADLILRLAGQRCSVTEIAGRLGCAGDEIRGFLEECYVGKLLHKDVLAGELVYYAADFYERLDYLCKFDEGYRALDSELLLALDLWCYGVYRERMGPYLQALENGEVVERAPETFELLENLEELLDAVHDIRVVPCNCRKLAGCGKETETCLSFDDTITDRTLGRAISKEEAKEIILRAHKSGLMHQVNSDWRTKGAAWMCNCCSCCCYPTRLARERGTKGVFPVIQYVARHDLALCKHCGACVQRCNFSAFYYGEAEMVEFNPQMCWGCGICVDGCSSGAITMEVSH